MSANGKSRGGCFRILLLAALIAAAGLALGEQRLSRIMLDTAYAQAYSLAVDTINTAVNEVFQDGVRYDELIKTKLSSDGHVSLLRADTMRMNELATRTALLAEAELNKSENQIIEIPLAAALGIRIFSGLGPKLPVNIVPIGAVSTRFDTEFESAGINQTRHKVFLTLRTTVRLVIPQGSSLVEVVSTVPIAESIIVGAVPDSFVDVSDQEDMLNLIP